MRTTTVDGKVSVLPAINEVSLLRETRQTAWIEVSVDERIVIPELVCDGALVATPARPRRPIICPPKAPSCRSVRALSRWTPDQPLSSAPLAGRDPAGTHPRHDARA